MESENEKRFKKTGGLAHGSIVKTERVPSAKTLFAFYYEIDETENLLGIKIVRYPVVAYGDRVEGTDKEGRKIVKPCPLIFDPERGVERADEESNFIGYGYDREDWIVQRGIELALDAGDIKKEWANMQSKNLSPV